MNQIRMIAAVALLLAAAAVSAQPKIKLVDGGDREHFKSGSTLQLDAGSAFKLYGATVNSSASEIDAVCDLSVAGALHKTMVISVTSTPTGAEQDTGIDLPPKAIILGVSIETTVAEATGATKTLDVGLKASETGGDTDGFVKSMNVATVGTSVTYTTMQVGASEKFYSSTTYGALLADFEAGTDNAGDVGTFNPHPHVKQTSTASSIVIDAGSNDWAEWRGRIIINYLEES